MIERKTKTGWRRILAVLLAAIMVFGTVETAVVAAENEQVIKMGVPVLDGQVDEIYKESLTLDAVGEENVYVNTEWEDDHGKIYILYSDYYLYICADIKDNSVVSAGELYTANTLNAYKNDNCEFRLSLDGGRTTFKVGIDAFGHKAYGATAAEMQKTDYSKILYETKVSDEGYVIEAAIPCSDGGILDLHTAGQLGFRLQLNDLDYDGSYRYFTTMIEGKGEKGLVYYDLSNEWVSGQIDDSNLGGTDAPEEEPSDISYKVLSLGTEGNAKVSIDADLTDEANQTGNVTEATDHVAIVYGNVTGEGHDVYKYAVQAGFRYPSTDYDASYQYMCVEYAADYSQAVTPVEFVTLRYRGINDAGTVYFNCNLVDTNGEFAFTAPVQLNQVLIDRLTGGSKNYLQFKTNVEGITFKVKALYFFQTEKDAREFSGTSIDFLKLSYAPDGNAKYEYNGTYGTWEANPKEGAVKITYCDNYKPSGGGTKYVVYSTFNEAGYYNADYKYVRVLYSAKNPEGVDAVTLSYRTVSSVKDEEGNSHFPTVKLAEGIQDTDGAFVLTAPSDLTGLDIAIEDNTTENVGEALTSRLEGAKELLLRFETTATGGEYQVKALYFFKTEEEANLFSPSLDIKEIKPIQINGTEITEENCQIVVPANGSFSEDVYQRCAASVQLKIFGVSGQWLEIVNDSAATKELELLIGETNRDESRAYYEDGGLFHPANEQFSVAQYRVTCVNNKIVLTAGMAPALEDAAELLGYKVVNGGETVAFAEGAIGQGIRSFDAAAWPEVENVKNPERFEDSFDTDEGYWSKDSDKDSWTIADGVFSSGAEEYALSYLHVFEKNVSYEAKLKYTGEAAGSMGLLLRHTADHAYIKAGYDFETQKWFIDSREGEEYVGYRLAESEPVTLTAGQLYTVKAVVNGETAELYVDGALVASTSSLTQLSQGKIGVFAEKVFAYMDDVAIDLLSGQGSIMKNVVHTKLPGEDYREGGTVVELDGKLLFVTHQSDDITFVSTDDGKTWTETDKWVDFSTYPQVFRLNNGNLMRIDYEKINNVQWHRAVISTDEGATWTTAGHIRPRPYNAAEDTKESAVTTAGSNVNDKLTQMSNGRIFYSIAYDSKSAPVNGKYKVFCEFFYSDDNGENWTKSISSFEIPGNENAELFGECKILETSTPGVLRMYNSWNTYGCIVYSESRDNGETWGPIVKMTDFTCSQSSMQFVRDRYAENDSTYYMVWVQDDAGEIVEGAANMPRAHLSLAKTTDGVNWEPLGDVWRWEGRYKSIIQIVDPFVQVTEDYVIVGSGISEKVGSVKKDHNAQREHIFTIQKDTLTATAPVIPNDVDYTADLQTGTGSNVKVGDEIIVNIQVGGTKEEFAASELYLEYEGLTYIGAIENGGASITDPNEANGTIQIVDHGISTTWAEGSQITVYSLKFRVDEIPGYTVGAASITLTGAAFSTDEDAVGNNLTNATVTIGAKEFTVTPDDLTVTLPEELVGAGNTEEIVEYLGALEFEAINKNYTYELSATDENGDPITVTETGDGKWKIDYVASNVAVTVTSQTPKTYTITFSNPDHIKDQTESTVSFVYGTEGGFSFALKDDVAPGLQAGISYHLDSIKYTGTDTSIIPTGTNGTYTIDWQNITGDITVTTSATDYEPNQFIVNAPTAQYPELTVSPESGVVNKNGSATITLDPVAGYKYVVSVDGEPIEDNEWAEGEDGKKTYTIANVTANVTITVDKQVDTNEIDANVSLYLELDAKNMYLVQVTSKLGGGYVYTYGGEEMYWSDEYNNGDGAYVYLVITDANSPLTNEVAISQIGIARGEVAATINYSGDVNMASNNEVVDANDAQLVWNMYSNTSTQVYIEGTNFVNGANMEKFLRADVSKDGEVDTEDASEIVGRIMGLAN